MRAHSCLAVLALTALACQPADTSVAARTAIDAANAQWPRLTTTGHADSIAEFYAADAVIMPPNMATMKGKDAIKTFFATINTMDPKPTLTLRSEHVLANGTLAVETGRWNWTYPAGNARHGLRQVHRPLGAAERQMGDGGRHLEQRRAVADGAAGRGRRA